MRARCTSPRFGADRKDLSFHRLLFTPTNDELLRALMTRAPLEFVASLGISPRTQNGHIRNDTRDVSRRMADVQNRADLQDKLCR
jgi:hypothetical protein